MFAVFINSNKKGGGGVHVTFLTNKTKQQHYAFALGATMALLLRALFTEDPVLHLPP